MEFRYNCLKNINTTNYIDDINFGNHFFYSMALHFISKKNDLMSTYKEYNNITDLGIDLFIGKRIYTKSILIQNINLVYLITHPIQPSKNIILSDFYQSKEFALYLYLYFKEYIQQKKIIEHNIYKDRYQNNNDIFILFRLEEMTLIKEDPYDYYDQILSNANFNNGYISCDNINYNSCQKLISKYNLTVINYDNVETIMFGSTCNKVILSKGSFSWLLGILSFYSKVYYPKTIINWKSNIFVIPEWNEIDTKYVDNENIDNENIDNENIDNENIDNENIISL
jgi:hypothetical protein